MKNDIMPINNEQRFEKAVLMLGFKSSSIQYQFLGCGMESVIIADDHFIYKVFDNTAFKYSKLLSDLKDRFKGSLRFLPIIDYFEINGLPVLKYKKEDSMSYTGGYENEIKEFLLECKKYGVVCWDVKPRNFRIYMDGLKFIDYGWDVKPYNLKDFVFMAQRAFLSIKYPSADDFLTMARKAIVNWEIPELDGFSVFFNEVYKRSLSVQSVTSIRIKHDRSYELENIINELIPDILNRGIVLLEQNNINNRPLNDYPGSYTIKKCEDAALYEQSNIFILNQTISLDAVEIDGILKKMRHYLKPNALLIMITGNPYYSNTNQVFNAYLQDSALKNDYVVKEMKETLPYFEVDGSFNSDSLIILFKKLPEYDEKISLVIKVCYQDGLHIERMVRHIVSQCEGPRKFFEKIVVIDPKKDMFLRQYSKPAVDELYYTLNELKDEGVIDDFYTAPDKKEDIAQINKRWFNINSINAHTVRNIPITSQLYAFEIARGEYILQADSDVIVIRRDREHDFLGDMINALRLDSNALTVSFNISHPPDNRPIDYHSPENGGYVPEVRFCFFSKERLLKARPFPNGLDDGTLTLSWYMSINNYQIKNHKVSLRGGDPRSFFIHPPNKFKTDKDYWDKVIESAESGSVPKIQYDSVDLKGNYNDWCIPNRNEPYIFIICGRNVTPQKFYRCWQSVTGQSRRSWGAIIIDDASTNELPNYIDMLIRPYIDKVTFIKNHQRKGVLYNIFNAIKNYCINLGSTIVILDADDMLIGNHVLNAIHRHHLLGADVTVGSMIRLDKGYYDYKPDFISPRNIKGGDVWLHIRTFKKYLFDNIPVGHFLKNGEWIDKFTELTYMIPIVEMSRNPEYIRAPLYLWEPTHRRDKAHYIKNEETIAHLLSTKPCIKLKTSIDNSILSPGEILYKQKNGDIIIIRHAEKERSCISNGVIPDSVPLTSEGALDCRLWGGKLPYKLDLLISSPALRAVQTAENIKKGNECDKDVVLLSYLRNAKINDYARWAAIKMKYPENEINKEWVSGSIPEDIIETFDLTIKNILEKTQEEIIKNGSCNTLLVSHNHLISLLFYYFYGKYQINVPYLHGFIINKEDFLKIRVQELR